jgi:diadenosine tetraphosphate (Ap4A) HIT family hydrolase
MGEWRMSLFRLDERLEGDTLEVGVTGLCQLRLMNDSRWPWLILVPMMPGASEMDDLPKQQQRQLAQEMMIAGAVLKRATGCEKINIAAIGNIVRQLHVHVVARNTGDPNWPGPVWGFGARQPYEDESGLIAKIRDELGADIL